MLQQNTISPHPSFSHLISPFTIALNKVKEAAKLPSWNEQQRENESTD